MGISGKRVAILATNGFEQSELEVPLQKLREAGATVEVVSPESGEIKDGRTRTGATLSLSIARSPTPSLPTTTR